MGEIKMSVIDKIRKIVKEEIEEAMGKGSLVPGMYPDPTGSGRRGVQIEESCADEGVLQLRKSRQK
jgi:hypothetical protein